MFSASPRLSELAMLDGTRLSTLLPGVEHGAFRMLVEDECCRLIGVRADGRTVSAVMDRFVPVADFVNN